MIPQEKASTIGLLLEPLDTLFFRDGRAFTSAFRATSGLPTPQILTGALRSWCMEKVGVNFGKLRAGIKACKPLGEVLSCDQPEEAAYISDLNFQGPWLWKDNSPLVSTPAILRQREDETSDLLRLAPLKKLPTSLRSWNPPREGMIPLWPTLPQRTIPIENHWLTHEGLKKFLEGNSPDRAHLVHQDDLFGHDDRVGIGVKGETNTTGDGDIFALRLLAPKPGVSFYAEIKGTPEALSLIPGETFLLNWGGEGRRVRATKTEAHPWPRPPVKGKTTLLLITPGLFSPKAWCPDNLEPLAAAVPGYEAVSGWDMARNCPKPTRYAAKAGSVYFLEKPLDPERHSLCTDDEAVQGWGQFLQGSW